MTRRRLPGPPGPPGVAVAVPLPIEYWVDGASTVVPQTGSVTNPFTTVTAAVAAVTNGATGTLRVLSGNYSGEAAVSVGTRKLSILGDGLGPAPSRPQLPAFNGAGELYLRDVSAASVGASVALVGLQLYRARIDGAISVTTFFQMTNGSQGGNVTVAGTGGANVQAVMSSLNGVWTIAGGGSGAVNAPQLDEHSFSSLGFNGCRRSDASPDWNVSHQLFAHVQDANRTIDALYYGIIISTATLTAARTVTLTQTSVNVGQELRVDRYDATTQTLNVNGSAAGAVGLTNASSVRTRFTLINNAGPTLAYASQGRLAAA